MRYIFYFGRNPKLSYLELLCYLEANKLNIAPKIWLSRNAIFANVEQKLNIEKLLSGLAGTICIAKLSFVCDVEEAEKMLEKNFADIEKIKFSLLTNSKEVKNWLKKVFRSLNVKFQEKRFVPHLIGNSKHEIFLGFIKDRKFYFARTNTISNPKEFIKHEKAKLHKEFEIASSVRLSRILVNLSCMLEGKLLDPFCGSGTILIEALYRGFKAYGIEIRPELVEKARENLASAAKLLGLKEKGEIFQGDARKLEKYFEQDFFDTIVTEPYLGPLIKRLPERKEAEKIIAELTNLYREFLKSAYNVLKQNGTLVIVSPGIKSKEGFIHKIHMKELANTAGFKPHNPSKSLSIKVAIPLEYKERWHKIYRYIYIFKK